MIVGAVPVERNMGDSGLMIPGILSRIPAAIEKSAVPAVFGMWTKSTGAVGVEFRFEFDDEARAADIRIRQVDPISSCSLGLLRTGSSVVRNRFKEGDGEPASVLDGMGTHRVLSSQSGETGEKAFERFIVRNGAGRLEEIAGGQCLVRGGIANDGRRPTPTDSTFVGNSADDGGAHYRRFHAGHPQASRPCGRWWNDLGL